MARGRHRREKIPGPWVRLPEYLLASPAWRSLNCVDRGLYTELARRYRGPDSNNGKIPYGAREAGEDLNVSKNTANRSFDRLQEHGFLIKTKDSGFNIKGRVSREWLLTEFPDDRAGIKMPAAKDFMRWKPPEKTPQKTKHGATTGTSQCHQRDNPLLKPALSAA